MEQSTLGEGATGVENDRGLPLVVIIGGGSMSASEAMRRQMYSTARTEDVYPQGFVGSIKRLLFSRSRSSADLSVGEAEGVHPQDYIGRARSVFSSRQGSTTSFHSREHTCSDRLAGLPLVKSTTGCPYQPSVKSSPQICATLSPPNARPVSLLLTEPTNDQLSSEPSPQISVDPLPEGRSVSLPLVESSPGDLAAHDFANTSPVPPPNDGLRRTISEEIDEHTTPMKSPPLVPRYMNDPAVEAKIAPATPQAPYSAEFKQREREALLRKFDNYKLETEFYDDYIVHTTYNWELSTRLGEKSIWRKEKEIGSGAFGKVWLQKEEGGQLRAVKVLSRNSLPTVGPSQELLALVKLRDYDHLFVKFLGWYENGKKTFLAMEYIEDGDLSGYMVDYEEEAKLCAGEITKQILEGLEVLHEKGIAHRDLKPQNILIASLDPIWVKITDFGISKRTKHTALRTVMCGTDGYIAPELHGLLPREFTREFLGSALDIWSLGSLLHKLLTSQTPFADSYEESDSETGIVNFSLQPGTDKRLLRNYCDGSIPFPTEVLRESHVSEEGIAFVKSLLVPNPKERPTAARALQNPWLKGYGGHWIERLRNEFSRLGVNLDPKNIFLRQARKGDIIEFLQLSKESVQSLLLEAAENGYNSVISKLLESSSLKPVDPLVRGKLFQLAVENKGPGTTDTIKILLDNKIYLGARIDDQTTVLQWLVTTDNLDTLNMLLGGPYAISSVEYNTAILLAIKLGYIDVVGVFLRYIVDINTHKINGQTILQVAAGIGSIGIVKLVLECGVDVDAKAKTKGLAGLQEAAKCGHIDIVKFLLDNGAEVNATASDCGLTALQAAAKGGHIDIVKLLLDNGAEVNAAASYGGLTALQAAANSGHIDIVKLLLDNGAEVNAAASYGGLTALQAAAKGGHIDTVKLLDNGAKADPVKNLSD